VASRRIPDDGYKEYAQPSFPPQSHQRPRLLLIRHTCGHARAGRWRTSKKSPETRLQQLEFCREIVCREPALDDSPRPKGPLGSQSHRGAPNAPELHPVRALPDLSPRLHWWRRPGAKGIGLLPQRPVSANLIQLRRAGKRANQTTENEVGGNELTCR